MSTDLDMMSRLALLEARVNALEPEASSTAITGDTEYSAVAGSLSGGSLTILDTPVVLSSAAGGSAWTTQSSGGNWPSSATHVYLSVKQGLGPGEFEVRKDSTATGYPICGGLSAAVFADRTAACAFAKLSSSSTFDWRNVANNDYTLTLIGYLS